MRHLLSLTLLPALLAQPLAAAPSATSLDTFGARLEAQLAGRKGNLLYSPTSIAIALAMTREGARGDTAAEMDRVLGPTAGAEVKALLKALQSSPAPHEPGELVPPELAIANRLYADGSVPLEKAFLDATRGDYGAGLDTVDFKAHPDDARLAINRWVEQQTHDRIRDLLTTGTVDKDTRLVLVNAIYLKAQWATPFFERRTSPAQFAVDGGGTKQVPTMHGTPNASWGTADGARVLDLPYYAGSGPQLAMMIVQPDGAKLAALEASYAKNGLAPFVKAASNRGRLDLAMPKFKIGSQSELVEALARMGMPRAFTNEAELQGISKASLRLARVIHKAWMQVDEHGSEAAAATAVVAMPTAVEAAPAKKFAVDRSFLVFVHDAEGNVLFGGRVVDPTL